MDNKVWFSDPSVHVSDEISPIELVMREKRLQIKPFLQELTDLDKMRMADDHPQTIFNLKSRPKIMNFTDEELLNL